MIINQLRKNIGSIIAGLGFIMLCILTFGNLGEISTVEYWERVRDNLGSITLLGLSLTMVQVAIKQGVSEQALQRGLNTENATKKYEEHQSLVAGSSSRMIYMPYFLQIYNERHTSLRKREFLVDNNFKSEKDLLMSKHKKLIKKYRNIKIYLTVSRIKWATTNIVYNKHGQIQTLSEHRTKRAVKGVTKSIFFMLGATLLARGLFFEGSGARIEEKIMSLLSYIIMITITSIYSVIKEYEKGAFGVPNELDEINEIWKEFSRWEVPKWVIKEVTILNDKEEDNEQTHKKEGPEILHSRTNIQAEQEKSENPIDASSSDVLGVPRSDSNICLPGSAEQHREPNRDIRHAGQGQSARLPTTGGELQRPER